MPVCVCVCVCVWAEAEQRASGRRLGETYGRQLTGVRMHMQGNRPAANSCNEEGIRQQQAAERNRDAARTKSYTRKETANG